MLPSTNGQITGPMLTTLYMLVICTKAALCYPIGEPTFFQWPPWSAIRLKDQAMAKKSTSKNEIKKYVKDLKGGTPKIKMVEDEGATLPEQLLKRSGRGKKK